MRTRNSNGGIITEGRTRGSHRTFITPASTASSNTSGNFINTHGSTRGNSNSSRSAFVPASQLVNTRSAVRSDPSEDAALAYRLQQEEFMNAFEEPDQERQPRNTVSTARDNLRAMASRAIRLRARGWPIQCCVLLTCFWFVDNSHFWSTLQEFLVCYCIVILSGLIKLPLNSDCPLYCGWP